MAITKQKTENIVVYSLGEEKVLVASFEKSEKLTLKIEGAIKTLVAPCLDEVIKEAMAEGLEFIIDFSGSGVIYGATVFLTSTLSYIFIKRTETRDILPQQGHLKTALKNLLEYFHSVCLCALTRQSGQE